VNSFAAAAAAAAAAAGDVRLTRMVIFGALLGVLDPVLTLAAAEAAQGDVLRMPNAQMVAERDARKNGESWEDGDDGTYGQQRSWQTFGGRQQQQQQQGYDATGDAGGSRGQWLTDARDMQWEKRVELAAGTSSDHAAVLAAFEVGANVLHALMEYCCALLAHVQLHKPGSEQPASQPASQLNV
jgi:hypothetical protein